MRSYLFEVTSARDRSASRVLELSGEQTLEDLHEAIAGGFGVPGDPPHAFHRRGRCATCLLDHLVSLRDDPPVRLDDLGLWTGRSLLHRVEGVEEWYEVRVQGVRDPGGEGPFPRLVESRGEAPPHWPAWDEDEDEEEDSPDLHGVEPPPLEPELHGLLERLRREGPLPCVGEIPEPGDLPRLCALALEVVERTGGDIERIGLLGRHLGSDLLEGGANLPAHLAGAGMVEEAVRLAEVWGEAVGPESLLGEAAAFLAGAGRLDEAQARLDRLRKRFPDLAWPLLHAAQVRQVRGALPEAEALYRQAYDAAVEGGPGEWWVEEEAAKGLADLLARQGRKEEAAERREDPLEDEEENGEEHGEFLEASGPEAGLPSLAAGPSEGLRGPGTPRPGPKIRRNEPCPCGSGRKFKVCCGREGATFEPEWSIRDRLVERAYRAACEEGERGELERAVAAWWGEGTRGAPLARVRSMLEAAGGEVAFFEWLVHNHPLEDGATYLGRLLGGPDPEPGSRAHRVLERCAAARAALYLQLPGGAAEGTREALELADLARGESLRARPGGAFLSVVAVWDVLVGRVVELDGIRVLHPGVLVFPAALGDRILEAAGAGDGRGGDPPLERLAREAARAGFEDPTAGPDALALAGARYWLQDPGKACRILRGRPGLREEDGEGFWPGFWLEGPDGAGSRLPVLFLVSDDILLVLASSRSGLAEARALIEPALGEDLFLLAEMVADPVREEDSFPSWGGLDVLGTPPDELAELAGRAVAESRRLWPDTPAPALEGGTPREAAARAELRPRVAWLLRLQENREARLAWLAGMLVPPSAVWEELGLDPREGIEPGAQA